ncbi:MULTISPECIES: hypothetical protein [Dactylosporangium]|uniref:Uncharacterized protein n=2 Tax=Dactylosporangium TaxID=35753 RepID=A0A9W6KLD9_9ACTN|nr:MULTISPECIES: hypothetical protein [Dactylosporangium]UAC00541.1 hypothetical protein Dvina_22295 [Dactylosporangium vinaceum]UWZ48111.1 hypothetical protein Dmats_17925 [Dactylosporangium matsuzakiense]GLL03127.1 hypothetical protein GCM10017581_048700 [Dactylosporangium matsuzakiense]
MKKALTCVAAGVLGTLTALAPVAAAQAEYPPSTNDVVVDTGTVESGGAVTMSGRADPGSTVTVTVSYGGAASSNSRARGFAAHAAAAHTYTTTADSAGNWSISIPLTQTGTAVLTASGTFGTITRTVSVAASSNTSTSDNNLAVTGIADGNLPLMALTGSGAVMLGGILVYGATRWRRRTRNAES